MAMAGIVNFHGSRFSSLGLLAHGGYDEVTRQTGWSLPRSRREVRKAIRALGLRPIGHRGYAQLRQRIMASQFLDNDLI
jgi:hypothetical protein